MMMANPAENKLQDISKLDYNESRDNWAISQNNDKLVRKFLKNTKNQSNSEKISDNPVNPTVFYMSPFDSLSPKTWA